MFMEEALSVYFIVMIAHQTGGRKAKVYTNNFWAWSKQGIPIKRSRRAHSEKSVIGEKVNIKQGPGMESVVNSTNHY